MNPMRRLKLGIVGLIGGPALGVIILLALWIGRLDPVLYWPAAVCFLGGLGMTYVFWLAPLNQARKQAGKYYERPGLPKDDGKRIELQPVSSVRIVPLIDLFAARDDLETEAGVAYLVQAGETTVLFDLGLNFKGESVSPLQRNIERLGINPDDIQAIINSHTHGDHLGGWQALPADVVAKDPLRSKPLFTVGPVPALGEYPTIVREPVELFPGVGVTGPLASGLFLLNYTLEQSLVYHLAGKGLVVIIGCGHPGIQAIVERAEQVFQQPVYAVVGGLHLPIKADRVPARILRLQRLVGGPNSYPWKPLGEDTVRSAIEYLKGKGVQVVSLSAHDSCNWSIKQFQNAFGASYRPLLVGQEIVL